MKEALSFITMCKDTSSRKIRESSLGWEVCTPAWVLGLMAKIGPRPAPHRTGHHINEETDGAQTVVKNHRCNMAADTTQAPARVETRIYVDILSRDSMAAWTQSGMKNSSRTGLRTHLRRQRNRRCVEATGLQGDAFQNPRVLDQEGLQHRQTDEKTL